MTTRKDIPKDVVMPDDDAEVFVEPLEKPAMAEGPKSALMLLAVVVGVVVVFGGAVMWDDIQTRFEPSQDAPVSQPQAIVAATPTTTPTGPKLLNDN